MSSILPLPWRGDRHVPSLTVRGAGLEGSSHLWKLGLREAEMHRGAVPASGIFKAPLNAGPWSHQRAGRLPLGQGSWVRGQAKQEELARAWGGG